MNRRELTQPKPAHHHLKHPGGRLIKIGGQAVSLAPQLGHAASSLGSSVSRIAIGAAVALAASANASFAACVESAPGVWNCSGALTTTQNLTVAPAGALDVSTAPGFGITTTSGNAFTLITNAGDQELTFDDDNGSTITGATIGIEARNSGRGALSITSTGVVTGTTGAGILGTNSGYGTDLTISTAAVTGDGFGIDARNSGTGALSITSAGDVTSANSDGIYVTNYGTSTDLTISTASVTGQGDGINALGLGNGAFLITATGDVTGTNRYGIAATNVNGTNLTISAAGVAGGDRGINAHNYGSGVLSITTTGAVNATSSDGIHAFNYYSGTDLTISAAAVAGGSDGIDAHNYGSGVLSITASGVVTGADDEGIHAINTSAGSDITISTAVVTGYDNGIDARNSGSGALSITSTGTVTGTTGAGILGTNSGYGTDLTISTAAVTGDGFGIDARNSGTGALSITSLGDVTSASSDGIYVTNYGASTDLTISTASVTGQGDGINALGLGNGAFLITATGDVTGTNRYGITATNVNGTDLTISAAGVTGGDRGINAHNYGSGVLSITTTGAVTATSSDGIHAFNYYSGTDLTVSAASVAGGSDGIDAHNYGSGVLSITATGQVTGADDEGIHAINTSAGSDITISTAVVTGYDIGIEARNTGSGALSITSTGVVTGTTGAGILGTNSGYGTDLTISTAAVTGDGFGIDARNSGTGALSVTSLGDVTSENSDGIYATNYGTSTDLTISTAGVTGKGTGISAFSSGSGAFSITATGDVTGTNWYGITATNRNGTDLSISAAAVTGGVHGIKAINEGSGALSITSTGDVTGTAGNGIVAHNSAVGTDLLIEVTNVNGAASGVLADNLGSGATAVTANGIVTAGTGAGIDVFAISGSTAEITLNAGADISAASGTALRNNESDSISTLSSGSRVTGGVQFADGSDNLVLAGGDVSGVTSFDGGDDSSVADGFVDTIQVSGLGYDLAGANITNWEVFSVEGGSVAFTDTALTIGDGSTGTGVFVENGGIFTTGSNFTLNAPLSTTTGGIFDASGGGSGTVTVNGDVSNDGILTSQDGNAGDVITIAGNYIGSGVVGLDTALNDDASGSDLLEVQGNTSGSTVLSIAHVGDVTSLGIEVISVAGNSGGDFTLAGDFETPDGEQALVAGAYVYTLAQAGSGSWRLETGDTVSGNPLYQPGAPIYDTYAQSLLALNGTSSLRHRGSSQDYLQRAATSNSASVQRLSTSSQKHPSPFWFQMDVDDISIAGGSSTTGATSKSTVAELQAGADTIVYEGGTGFLVGGVILNHSNSDTKIASEFGSGSIDTTGTGLTLAATWYDDRGFYVDGQLKYSRYDSDLTSATLGALSQGNDGSGYALSVEIGQEYQIESGFTLIPQVQLTQSLIDFDDFTGPNSERVTLKDADSLLLRLGVEVDHYKSLRKGEQRLYGIANIFHDFSDGTIVDVSGVSLASSGDDWAVEIGVGGSYSWDDAYSVYGEASYATGLQNIGDSRKISANFGFRMAF